MLLKKHILMGMLKEGYRMGIIKPICSIILAIGLLISSVPIFIHYLYRNRIEAEIYANDHHKYMISFSLVCCLVSQSSFITDRACDTFTTVLFSNKGTCIRTTMFLTNLVICLIFIVVIQFKRNVYIVEIQYLLNLQSIVMIICINKYYQYFVEDTKFNQNHNSIVCILLTLGISLCNPTFTSYHIIFYIIPILSFSYVFIICARRLKKFYISISKSTDSSSISHDKCSSLVCNTVIIIFCIGWIIIKSISQFSYSNNSHRMFFDVPYLIHLNTLCSFIILMIQGRNIRSEAIFYKTAIETKKAQSRTTVHELRTPLNTVILGLSLLSNEINKPSIDKADYEDILSDLKDSTTTAINILNDFLTHDKIQEGILFVEKSPIKIWKLVKTVTKPFSLQAREAGISLEFEENFFPDVTNLFVSGDEFKLGQVFRNLASNALKFTPKNGTVKITAKKMAASEMPYYKPKLQKKGSLFDIIPRSNGILKTLNNPSTIAAVLPEVEYIRIQFKDTGAGISKENQCKLFKEIIQFSPGKLQGGKGSGLGMMITKGIVDGHNGFISVHSDGEGLGTTFTVDLPLLPINIDVVVPFIGPEGKRRLSRMPAIHSFRGVGLDPSPAASGKFNNSNSNNNIPIISNSNKTYIDKPIYLNTEQVISQHSLQPSSSRLPKLTHQSSGLVIDEVWQAFYTFRFLIVDDVRLSRKMLNRLLRDHCQSIIEAEDGEEAVHAIQSSMATGRPYDVVLMDYHMPKMEGPAAAKCMRAIGYEGIIIGVTGNAIQTEVDNYLANGADKVMIKPLDIEELKTVLNDFFCVDEGPVESVYSMEWNDITNNGEKSPMIQNKSRFIHD